MRRVVLLLTALAVALVVASGVALAVTRVGANGDDLLRGTNRSDTLLGKAGDDTVLGRGGGDEELAGGKGNDRILGGAGKDIMDGGAPPPTETSDPPRERSANNSDLMLGGEAADFMDGNLGPDLIVGGVGEDVLFDGEDRHGSRDVLSGGEGNDVLLPGQKPAGRDIVNCGPGRDTAYADRADVLSNCERVRFRPPHQRGVRSLIRAVLRRSLTSAVTEKGRSHYKPRPFSLPLFTQVRRTGILRSSETASCIVRANRARFLPCLPADTF